MFRYGSRFIAIRGGGGGRNSLVSGVPMREQKTMRKGTFFRQGSAQRCASFRVGKMLILWENGMFFFTSSLKRCDKGVC